MKYEVELVRLKDNKYQSREAWQTTSRHEANGLYIYLKKSIHEEALLICRRNDLAGRWYLVRSIFLNR